MKNIPNRPRFIWIALLAIGLLAPALQAEDEHEEAEAIREELQDFLKEDEGRELQKFIKKEMPKQVGETLRELLEDNPWEADEVIGHLVEVQHEYYEMREFNPERAKQFLKFQGIELETHVLARKIRHRMDHEGDSSDIKELKEVLRDKLNDAFQIKLELKERELEMLEREVKELRKMLKQRAENKDKIIDRRFNDLVGKHDALEW